jgi:hypothetical protein
MFLSTPVLSVLGPRFTCLFREVKTFICNKLLAVGT